MTVEELEKLRANAAKTLDEWVLVQLDEDGWDVTKPGSDDDDLRCGTVNQAIAKLKEWATPPKPKTLSIEFPYSIVETYLKNGCYPEIVRAFKKAIAPYEVQP